MKKFVLLFIALCLAPFYGDANAALPMGGTTSPNYCSYGPPLDGQSAAAAYSFRVLATNWIGKNIVQLRRSSDNTTKIFTATAPGCGINTSDPFFDGSTTYSIVTWYDQSGNGVNITQGTNAAQPTVTLSCQNGHPCAVFARASSQTLTGTLISGVSAATIATVESLTDQTTSTGAVFIGNSTNGVASAFSASSAALIAERAVGGTTTKGTKAVNTSNHRIIATMNNTLGSIYVDGVKGTDTTTSQTLTAQTALTVSAATTVFWNGNIAEMMVFAPDLSINNSNIITGNQGAYWGL